MAEALPLLELATHCDRSFVVVCSKMELTPHISSKSSAGFYYKTDTLREERLNFVKRIEEKSTEE